MPRLRRAGAPWRVLAHDWVPGSRSGRIGGYGASHELGSEQEPASEFDELVISKWLHIEQLGTGSWYLHVGGVAIHVRADRDGRATHVFVQGPGDYLDPVPGCSYELAWTADAPLPLEDGESA